MKNQLLWCIIARVSDSDKKQQEINFSSLDELEILRSSNRRYREEIETLQQTVVKLQEQVASLRQLLYGSKSEASAQAFISIQIEEPDQEEAEPDSQPHEQPAGKAAEPTSRARKPHKRKLTIRTDHRVEHEELPEDVRLNPDAYRRLPESMDKVSIRLETIPSHLELHVTRRPCFVSRDETETGKPKIICAPAPVSILPGSNMGASLLAYVLHSKFCLHMPFYRMIKELERMGLSGLDEATVCHWHKSIAEAIRPIWKALHSELMEAEVLHVDETPFRCLRSGNKKGYMWALSCAESGANLYYWHTNRSGNVLDNLLRNDMRKDGAPYGGTIVTDGYDAYNSWLNNLNEDEARPRHQTCWTHVRRKFVETARTGNQPKWSRAMVELIKPLYEQERQLRESNAPLDKIAEKRAEESRPVANAFFKELECKIKDREHPPLNKLKDAINYALVRKETLLHWLDDPAVPLDNNQVERAIRPLTIGRKNSLFIGAPEAGERSAILYTMVEECKRVGVNPQEWLTEVLRILPTYRASRGYLDLLPGNLPLRNHLSAAPVKL